MSTKYRSSGDKGTIDKTDTTYINNAIREARKDRAIGDKILLDSLERINKRRKK